MRKLRPAFVALALVLSLGVAYAFDPQFEQVSVADTPIGISSSVTNPTGQPQNNLCQVVVQTAQVSWRWDGTNPTASVGTIVDAGAVINIPDNIKARAFRAVKTGSTTARFDVNCWNESSWLEWIAEALRW